MHRPLCATIKIYDLKFLLGRKGKKGSILYALVCVEVFLGTRMVIPTCTSCDGFDENSPLTEPRVGFNCPSSG